MVIKPLLFSLLIFNFYAEAQVFRGPISSALGGSGRAAMDSPEGSLLNPALIPLIKDFEIDGFFRDGSLDPGTHSQAWGFGAGDNSKTVLFPGSIHYIKLRDTGRAAAPVDGELWHVGVAKTFQQFSFGVSGYRLSSKVMNDKEYVQWNYSLGLLWIYNEAFGMGYTLQNIAGSGSDVPVGLREDLQQGIGFFTALAEIARLRLDITRNEQRNPSQKMVYMVGFENQVDAFGIFRMGYRLDDERGQRYVTAGLCFNSPRLKVDYSFEKNLKGTGDALHSVDMRLPF